MHSHATQQSNSDSRPRPAQNLAENVPDLGELVPVDSFFNRYVSLLGVGRQPVAPGQGTDSSAPSMQSQGTNYQGQQGQEMQPGQPSFRYPTTANYLAQLTGHDLHKQANQVRNSLPVEQLDTSMQQHRHMNGQGSGPQPPASSSAQPDMLAYPSSSLAHFQQLLQSQAGNPNGLGAQQFDPHSQGMHQSAALHVAQQAAHQGAMQQHQWFAPKAAAALAPPSDKSNQDPNHNSRDLNRPAELSPNRYGPSRRMSGPNAGSPTSWAKPQQDQKSIRLGAHAINANTAAATAGEGSDMEDEGQSTGSRMPSGTLSRTNRTPRQQLQNKQAQQRYRERRKMKVTEMEQALGAMSQQVDELQGVLKQNVALQDKSLRLEQMLAERDAKIEQMTAQLKASNGLSAQPSMPNQDSTGKESGGSEEDGRPQPSPAFDGMSDLKLEFQGQIMKLQQYIEANNLRHVDPLGGGVPKDILAHVTDMVDEGCRVCRRVQAEGIQVLSLITRDPHSLTELASAQEREKWAGAVKAIRLTPLQVEQVLIWREEHLRNMLAVYEQRQQLNVETINRMPDADGIPAKKMEAMQMEGYLPTAKANLELTDALDKVKENLRWEQRTVLQFNWVLVNRIMSPIQTALFMVHAWPSHCDCLALVNAVHALKDKLLSNPSGASGSPTLLNSNPQASPTEPMETKHAPALPAGVPPSAPPASVSSQAAAVEASASGHGPSQVSAAAHLTQQVVPFASAFRPVLPTRRDSNTNISRSSLPSSSPISAFHPVGNNPPRPGPNPGGNVTLQSQPSGSGVLLEQPQSVSESADSPAAAAAAARGQMQPQQQQAQAAS